MPAKSVSVLCVKDYRKGSRSELTDSQISKRLVYLDRAIRLYAVQSQECVVLKEALHEEQALRMLNEIHKQ